MMLIRLLLILLVLSAQGHFKVMFRSNCTETKTDDGQPEKSTEKPRTTVSYECMEDWPITCTEDSQCCSKVCLKPFCKILGIEKVKKPFRGNRRRPICKTT
ncbi:hypothetical protein J6590_049850 [Homalodisca vitripennis]|nr:hypothetical protein J6590_049850 [Homalodisca vitripennis]